MKTTIEQNPKVPKHPYFIVKNRLSCAKCKLPDKPSSNQFL